MATTLRYPAIWPRRYTVAALSFLAVFICYIDRVNISVAIIPMAKEMGWNLEMQGRVLSSFFGGYLLLQIVGGRLADRFGGKGVLGAGVLVWSLFTMLTPPAAYLGFATLIAARVLMGMGESVTYPSIYSLFSRWIPLGERSRAVALANSGISLGTVFALLTTPWIVNHFGWPWAFYLFGAAGVVWFMIWHGTVTSNPKEHAGVSREELASIEKGVSSPGKALATPWKALLSCRPVWAIIVAHFCGNWSLYVLLSWLPTYLHQGLGIDYGAVGRIAMIPHAASFLSLNIAGHLADRLIGRGMDVGRVRKLMHAISFSGMTMSLLIVGHVKTDWLAVAIMTAGSALAAFGTGGFAVNHMDIAPRYAGALMGVTNTAGTVPGVIGVYVTGMILQASGSWALVFSVAAGVTLAGLVFFLRYSSGRKLFD